MEPMTSSVVHAITWEAIPSTVVHGAIRRRAFQTDTVGLIRYDFEGGAVFPRHAHPEPQMTMVLSGTFTFVFDGAVERYAPGAIVAIPGDVPHEGRADDGPVTIVCIFAPPRA